MAVSKSVDTRRVSESIVRAEPRPEFTKSWHPFSHSECIDAIELACDKLGWKVGQRKYSIRPNSKCLAVWEITNGTLDQIPGYSHRLIWRNAIDRTHALAFGVGSLEVVCSNLNFSHTNTWVVFRKHTSGLTIEEIAFYAEESLRILVPRFKEFADWRNGLKKIKLTYEQASMLAMFATERGYLPASKIPDFWNKYQGSTSLYKKEAHSLFVFWNANTELMKENNMLVQLDKQKLLHYFVKYEASELLEMSNKNLEIDPRQAIDIAFKNYNLDRVFEKAQIKEASYEVREKFRETQKKAKISSSDDAGKTISSKVDTEVKEKKRKYYRVKKDKPTQKLKCGLTLRIVREADLDKALRKQRRATRKMIKEEKEQKFQEKARAENSKKIIKVSNPTKPAEFKKCPECGLMILADRASCGNCGQEF